MSEIGLPQFDNDNMAKFSVACGRKCGVVFVGESTKKVNPTDILREHRWRFKSVHDGTRWICPKCLEKKA